VPPPEGERVCSIPSELPRLSRAAHVQLEWIRSSPRLLWLAEPEFHCNGWNCDQEPVSPPLPVIPLLAVYGRKRSHSNAGSIRGKTE